MDYCKDVEGKMCKKGLVYDDDHYHGSCSRSVSPRLNRAALLASDDAVKYQRRCRKRR